MNHLISLPRAFSPSHGGAPMGFHFSDFAVLRQHAASRPVSPDAVIPPLMEGRTRSLIMDASPISSIESGQTNR